MYRTLRYFAENGALPPNLPNFVPSEFDQVRTRKGPVLAKNVRPLQSLQSLRHTKMRFVLRLQSILFQVYIISTIHDALLKNVISPVLMPKLTPCEQC